jgi:hypothetical protein
MMGNSFVSQITRAIIATTIAKKMSNDMSIIINSPLPIPIIAKIGFIFISPLTEENSGQGYRNSFQPPKAANKWRSSSSISSRPQTVSAISARNNSR